MTICVFADAAIAPVLSSVAEVPRRVPATTSSTSAASSGRGAAAGDGMSTRRSRASAAGAPAGRRRPPPPPKDTFTVVFDGKPIEVPKNLNLIEAAKLAGDRDPPLLLPPAPLGRRPVPDVPGRDRGHAEDPGRLHDAAARTGSSVKTTTEKVVAVARRDDGVPAHQPPARLPDLRPGRRVHAPGQLLRLRRPAALALRRAEAPVPELRPHDDRPARHRRHDALHPVHALHPLLRRRSRARAS